MNNNGSSFYKTIYNHIANLTEKDGLIIEKKTTKRGDEFLIIKCANREFNQNYDIYTMIWKNQFIKCNLIQISGHFGNDHFKIFFSCDLSETPNFNIFDFANKDKCQDLYDNRHKFFDHLDTNLNDRITIYKDTKKMLSKLAKLLTIE